MSVFPNDPDEYFEYIGRFFQHGGRSGGLPEFGCLFI